MRYLKFRTWNENTLQMLYTDWNSFRNWYDLPTGGHVIYGRGFDGEKIILSEPMQYTGLKDMRNVEIYEGDILKDNYSRILLVEWYKYCFSFKAVTETNFLRARDIFQWFEDRKTFPEIIGNKYANPELLDGVTTND